MLTYFLFFFYLFAGTIGLHLLIRRKIFPFTIYHTASVFLFKVLMGCLYGWVFFHYYGGDDTWNFFNESVSETHVFIHHPLFFFKEFSPEFSLRLSGFNGWQALLFYISHFERWFMVKGLALLNLLSGKNYYTNVVLFELLTIAGPLLLFKMLSKEFPLRAGMYFLLIFFVPSVIFWCSGIRAEALILFFLSVLIYNGYAYSRLPARRQVVFIILVLVGLLLIRYQFLLVFTPAYLAYLISLKKKTVLPVFFTRIYLLIGLVFLISLFLPAAYQLSKPVMEAQQGFFRLHGNTKYGLDSLQPGAWSFIRILPQAVSNSLLRPYPWEGKSLLQSISSVDVLFMLAGLLLFMLSANRKKHIEHPLYWLFLYYAISQFILIGYTVPFPGAIVRYRSLPYLFLILFLYSGNPLLHQKLRYWIFKLH